VEERKFDELSERSSAALEDYNSLLNERNFMWHSTSPDAVDEYISSLEWTEATDHTKTLVTGNIRAFASHLRNSVAVRFPNK
jgi:hypothetical protein